MKVRWSGLIGLLIVFGSLFAMGIASDGRWFNAPAMNFFLVVALGLVIVSYGLAGLACLVWSVAIVFVDIGEKSAERIDVEMVSGIMKLFYTAGILCTIAGLCAATGLLKADPVDGKVWSTLAILALQPMLYAVLAVECVLRPNLLRLRTLLGKGGDA